MAAGEDALAVLRSIDTTLKAMLALAQRREAAVVASRPKPIATDRDLDGKYGCPKVTFNPRDWSGPSMKGQLMSECPADFLDLLAETLDYFAGQAEAKGELTPKGKPVAGYKRSDAARARGWAKRIRAGTHTPSATPANDHETTTDWSASANPWAEDGGQDGSFS